MSGARLVTAAGVRTDPASPAYAAGAAAPGYGTSLPGSPTDGQEYILVDSTTNPTYQWRFRYNASNSTSYKWEFQGGVPQQHLIDTSENYASTTYVDLTTTGPTLTVPRAGVYNIHFGAQIRADGTSGSDNKQAYATVKIGAAAAADAEAITVTAELFNQDNTVNLSRVLQKTLAASDVLKMMYRGRTANSRAAANRWMQVTPVRVS